MNKDFADMLLNLLAMSGDEDAIAMQILDEILKRVKGLASHINSNIGNTDNSRKITEFATKINEQFDEFMKAEGIECGNKNN